VCLSDDDKADPACQMPSESWLHIRNRKCHEALEVSVKFPQAAASR
jgi:hypothetical protein